MASLRRFYICLPALFAYVICVCEVPKYPVTIGGSTGSTKATCQSIDFDGNHILIGGGSDDKELMVNPGGAYLVYKSLDDNYRWAQTFYANDQNGQFRVVALLNDPPFIFILNKTDGGVYHVYSLDSNDPAKQITNLMIGSADYLASDFMLLIYRQNGLQTVFVTFDMSSLGTITTHTNGEMFEVSFVRKGPETARPAAFYVGGIYHQPTYKRAMIWKVDASGGESAQTIYPTHEWPQITSAPYYTVGKISAFDDTASNIIYGYLRIAGDHSSWPATSPLNFFVSPSLGSYTGSYSLGITN